MPWMVASTMPLTSVCTPATYFVCCEAVRISQPQPDRKSTRLNSSHSSTSYAVCCLKKKKRQLCRPDDFPDLLLDPAHEFGVAVGPAAEVVRQDARRVVEEVSLPADARQMGTDEQLV